MSIDIEGRTVGERIQNIRNQHCMSQHDLLKTLGRPKSDQSWLSRIESGEREILAKDLKTIAVYFKVLIDDLIP